MQTIKIGFSRPIGRFKILSKIIRLVERRDYSHCYVVVEDNVYHAANGLVHNVSYTDFLAKNIEVDYYTFELDQSQLMNGVKFLKDSDGIKYGFDQLFGIFIQKLFSTKNPIIVNNSQRMVCSEFCCRFMEACGFIMPIKPDAITPSDLHEILGNI